MINNPHYSPAKAFYAQPEPLPPKNPPINSIVQQLKDELSARGSDEALQQAFILALMETSLKPVATNNPEIIVPLLGYGELTFTESKNNDVVSVNLYIKLISPDTIQLFPVQTFSGMSLKALTASLAQMFSNPTNLEPIIKYQVAPTGERHK